MVDINRCDACGALTRKDWRLLCDECRTKLRQRINRAYTDENKEEKHEPV